MEVVVVSGIEIEASTGKIIPLKIVSLKIVSLSYTQKTQCIPVQIGQQVLSRYTEFSQVTKQDVAAHNTAP